MATKKQGNDELTRLLANPQTRALLLSMLKEQQDKPAKSAKVKTSKVSKPEPVEKVQLVNYSEKALAVIGATKTIKDVLKQFGRFNPFLKVNGQTVPGWVVSVKRRDELTKALIELGAL